MDPDTRHKAQNAGKSFTFVPPTLEVGVLDDKTSEVITQKYLNEPGTAFVLHNVLSKKECKAIITKCEQLGFELAGLATGGDSYRINLNVRNNMRVIFDDKVLSERIFDRVRSYLPQKFKGYDVSGLNERFRVYKYETGNYFTIHRDSIFERPDRSELTLFSFMIYLNDVFEGGDTTFFQEGKRIKGLRPQVEFAVTPVAGSCLVFDHLLLHEGSEVKSGVKYAIRTDVFYKLPG